MTEPDIYSEPVCKKPAENKAVPDLFQPSNMAVTGVGQISLSSRKFAILGGGISGLAAAYHLLDKVKDPSNITVLESSERVGGWMQSCSTENGAVFELGPRSIRPAGNAGRATLKIVSRIHMGENFSRVCVTRGRFLFSCSTEVLYWSSSSTIHWGWFRDQSYLKGGRDRVNAKLYIPCLLYPNPPFREALVVKCFVRY